MKWFHFWDDIEFRIQFDTCVWYRCVWGVEFKWFDLTSDLPLTTRSKQFRHVRASLFAKLSKFLLFDAGGMGNGDNGFHFYDAFYLVNDFDVDNFNRKQLKPAPTLHHQTKYQANQKKYKPSP